MIHLLPEDITLQILLLLPLYSLLSCKCVSKQWKSLITSPDFFKLYNKPNSIFFYRAINAAFRCLLIPDDANDDIGKQRHIRQLTSQSSSQIVHHSSESKILCFKENAPGLNFIVYNLLSGALITVSLPDKVRWANKEWCENVCYGFGYNPWEDDYNLVLLMLDKVYSFRGEMYVYSLRNRAWKSFCGGFPPTSPCCWQHSSICAYCFNGTLYWIVMDRKRPVYKGIVVLDMHTRRLSEMELPPRITANRIEERLPTFSELNGQLCCFTHGERGDGNIDVCVMTTTSCWSKLLRIRNYVFQQIPGWCDAIIMVYPFGRIIAMCVHRWPSVTVILCDPCRPTWTQCVDYW